MPLLEAEQTQGVACELQNSSTASAAVAAKDREFPRGAWLKTMELASFAIQDAQGSNTSIPHAWNSSSCSETPSLLPVSNAEDTQANQGLLREASLAALDDDASWTSIGGMHPPSDDSLDFSSLQEARCQVNKPRCFEHGCGGRTFSSPENYRCHTREKTGLPEVICMFCLTPFIPKSNRDNHILTGRRTAQSRYHI
ncbi:hypothetical protein BGW36DRAFT_428365 [Talaromyces proteolyticus]|uniref:C2H2-type domain-containing protein n=1 Tax=Talaromyces proteolyticus TaxID=1131652 RepID=A0AAD4PZG0_9EURO|nr:uncharacterized protein BGW36DRAFT_428365 [Talaromyces proteolyticus]KAH8696352.1 hypothetical protein BGW36DRAFT_428365 [Talaromyces proteolyticus]